MTNHIFRSKDKPIRKGLSLEERWKGPDKGIVTCWERGREKRIENPELAERALNGELVVLAWKGGVDKKLKTVVRKFGPLNYLATWQGLRNEDLDIDLNEEKKIICSKTDMVVIFTADSTKYAEP